ncbi:MAG: 30S ribosomal protein S16 [Anaerolineae bacterium]|nr:30S ribosomal protein S16 [Anaerolineae bacterium]
MLRIRLRRVGAKGRPAYRIVVADSRSPRDGRFVEVIGYYNPLTDPPVIEVQEERLEYWQSQGAQCSETVNRLLVTRQGLRQAEPTAEAAEPESQAQPEPAAAEDQAQVETEAEPAGPTPVEPEEAPRPEAS